MLFRGKRTIGQTKIKKITTAAAQINTIEKRYKSNNQFSGTEM